MSLTITPTSATVSSSSGRASFRWRVSGTTGDSYGISDSPITTLNTDVYASGTSGTLILGVGTHTFYAFYTTTTSSGQTMYHANGSATVTVTYEPPTVTVTATKQIYLNGTLSGSETQSGLYPGGTFTPSAHQPSVASGYTLDKILYGSTDVTSGSITCPSSDFTLSYYYVSALSPWSWSASNGDATAAQTQAAYTALTGGGKVSDFAYAVWNDMCAKVLEVLTAKGLSWVTKITATGETLLSYDATRMTASDRTLTAARFNALRFNVGANYTTGIAAVSAGDAVLGSYFTKLMEKVNEWIATS